MKDIISSEQAPEPVGPYPHARRVGNLLFLSGVGPRKKGSKEIPGVILDAGGKIISYNIEEQCHSVERPLVIAGRVPGQDEDPVRIQRIGDPHLFAGDEPASAFPLGERLDPRCVHT